MNGIDYIAKILKQENIEWISCFPSNPIISACAKEKIRPIAFRHERGAVMAADGYSRISMRKKFGVVAVQSQAGAENVMGGIAQAAADNIPILILLGGNSLDQISVKPNFSAVQKYQGWVKRVEAIYSPTQVGDVMRRAFNALKNGPPGPVVVEMTSDVCQQEVPAEYQNYKPLTSSLQVPNGTDIGEAIELWQKARKPVIWAGAGVLASNGSAPLRELAELTATPVFCTMPGKSAFDERHPLALGAGCGTTTRMAHDWLTEADLIIALGSSLTRSPYGQKILPNKLIIHNTINPSDINKDETSEISLVGDTALTIHQLVDAIKETENGSQFNNRTEVEKEIASAKKKWLEEWMPILESDEEPIAYYRVIQELNNTLDLENSIVTHDAGAPRDCLVPFYKATQPHSYIGWGKTTHLGFGIPLMIGAKLAQPNKFCVNVMGDGAFGMSGTDIETAARSQVPITTILLNNSAMATYTGNNRGAIGEDARTIYGISNMYGDYTKIAEGMGATGIKVTLTKDIAPALKKAQKLNEDGITVLIEVMTN
ncbi:MAG: thiamine pyrophosphate-dependent enzyme, partial [Pseudomonadota bacterium]|nr:thiamine pyrophosphate-dependent enzyme [Pseudomonadota bacterium]